MRYKTWILAAVCNWGIKGWKERKKEIELKREREEERKRERES